ncbi:MAG TPA: proton-conducting transporter membrane subunit [Verrucomicrobiae bacterium]|nr:proton-conducting transporter membrane subunit [Verrucomicrobiae bacterium]
MTQGELLLFASAVLFGSVVAGFRWPRAWLMFVVCGAITAMAAAMWTLQGSSWEWQSTFMLGGQPLHFRLDSVSAWFLMLVAVMGGAGAIYSHEYWSDDHYPDSAPKGRVWWSLFLTCMGLVLTVSNGLHFLITWELFAVCGYFLITLDRQRGETRAAGWLYLAASHAGTMCLFAFFALLASHNNGSWELGPMRERTGLAPLFWLALFGFGVKAGFFPLHIWLPSAHANAPSHVSAIMSGVAIKMGIYGIVRFSGWLPVPTAAPWVIMGLGTVSALFGIAFAFVQNDFKRLLAYCSVENIGIIMIGIGVALLAATHGDAAWGRLALAGALLHVWNHGAFKSLLFFCAGSVLHATHTREMSRLGGLLRTMPWTAGLFALGSLAVAGLPPLNGFVSEWLIYLGLFDAAAGREPIAWFSIPAIILAMSGAIAVASFAKAVAITFLGRPRTSTAAHSVECGIWMRGPMLALACICLAIGLAPNLFCPIMSEVVAEWRPGQEDIQALAPIATLGAAQMTLALLILAATALLWRQTCRKDLRHGRTWDCGYALPTARMQYTSASFSGIAANWLRRLFLPERKLRRPRSIFPTEAVYMEHFQDAVLERLISPAAAAVQQLYSAARRLQHGRLQFYILYVLAGVAGLGILVMIGGGQ